MHSERWSIVRAARAFLSWTLFRGSAEDGRTAECDHVPCHVRNAQSGMQHSVRRTVPYVAGKRGNVARLQRHMLLYTLHAAGCQLLCVRSHRPAGLPCRCGLPCCEIGPAGLRGTGCLWWRRRRPGTHRAHGASHRRVSIKRHLSRSCGQSIGPVRLQHSTQVLILGRWHRLALVLAGGCRHRSRQGAMRGNCDGICLRSAVPPAEPLRASDAIGVGCPFTALHCTAGRMCRQLAPVCGPPLHVPRSVGPRSTARRCRNEPMAAPDRAANVNVNVASHRHEGTRGDLSQAWHNRHCNLCMVWCQSSAVSLAISVVREYGPTLCVIHGWPAQQY